jgi:hypothetical protein
MDDIDRDIEEAARTAERRVWWRHPATVACTFAIILAIPRPVVLGRACRIHVVDTQRKPWSHYKLTRSWRFTPEGHAEDRYTDSRGFVSFRPETRWISTWRRFATPFLSVLVVHGSTSVEDGYYMDLPPGFDAHIESDAVFKNVSDHLIHVDGWDWPRNTDLHEIKIVLSAK